jgi:hypothetical protein
VSLGRRFCFTPARPGASRPSENDEDQPSASNAAAPDLWPCAAPRRPAPRERPITDNKARRAPITAPISPNATRITLGALCDEPQRSDHRKSDLIVVDPRRYSRGGVFRVLPFVI